MLNLLFDYDGTLHDCIQIYAPAFRLAYDRMAAEGCASPQTWHEAELQKWLGLPAREMWDRFAPQLPPQRKERYSQIIGDEMLRLVREGQARLYPGVPELLAKLRVEGCRLLFLSNCKRTYMEAHRRRFCLDQYFSAFYCAEDYHWSSKTQIYPFIRDQMEGPFVVIGDRRQDMEIAQTHSLKAIGCGYGYGAPEELESADIVVQRPEEIIEAVHALSS